MFPSRSLSPPGVRVRESGPRACLGSSSPPARGRVSPAPVPKCQPGLCLGSLKSAPVLASGPSHCQSSDSERGCLSFVYQASHGRSPLTGGRRPTRSQRLAWPCLGSPESAWALPVSWATVTVARVDMGLVA